MQWINLSLLEAAHANFIKNKGQLTFPQLRQQLNTLEKGLLEVKKPSFSSLYIKSKSARVVHSLAKDAAFTKNKSKEIIKKTDITTPTMRRR